MDARWTQKNNENHYGYKNHINADQTNKLAQSYAVTDASVHDSQVFEPLLDQSEDEGGNKRAVYADSAYRSQEKEAPLAAANIPSPIQAGLKHGGADTGAVTLIQRFGSAANLNIHLHCLVLDGVYRSSEGARCSMRRVHPPAMSCRPCWRRSSGGF